MQAGFPAGSFVVTSDKCTVTRSREAVLPFSDHRLMGRKSRGHGAHRPTPGRDTLGALTVSRRFRADKVRRATPVHM